MKAVEIRLKGQKSSNVNGLPSEFIVQIDKEKWPSAGHDRCCRQYFVDIHVF